MWIFNIGVTHSSHELLKTLRDEGYSPIFSLMSVMFVGIMGNGVDDRKQEVAKMGKDIS